MKYTNLYKNKDNSTKVSNNKHVVPKTVAIPGAIITPLSSLFSLLPSLSV
jgi:hypothetical protein